MKRIDVALRQCVVCGLTRPRKRYPSGRLERPKKYASGSTCGRRACMSEMQHRTRAAICEAMRAACDFEQLKTIVGENHMVALHCSRCNDVFVVTERQRRLGRRKRCDYCSRNGGSTQVRYVRGMNRGSERRYHARLAALKDRDCAKRVEGERANG